MIQQWIELTIADVTVEARMVQYASEDFNLGPKSVLEIVLPIGVTEAEEREILAEVGGKELLAGYMVRFYDLKGVRNKKATISKVGEYEYEINEQGEASRQVVEPNILISISKNKRDLEILMLRGPKGSITSDLEMDGSADQGIIGSDNEIQLLLTLYASDFVSSLSYRQTSRNNPRSDDYDNDGLIKVLCVEVDERLKRTWLIKNLEE